MKKIIFILAVLCPCLAFSQKSKIEFKETSFNFGEINEGDGEVAHIFYFKNTGQVPLILINVRAGCGCTTPDWSKRPIPPGGIGAIKITFDPENRPGKFIKSIAVNSNAVNSVISLTVRGVVKKSPPNPYKYRVGNVRFKENQIYLEEVKNTESKSKQFTLINSGNDPVTLTAIPSHAAIQVSSPLTIPAGESANLEIQYHGTKRGDWGFINDFVQLVDHNQNKEKIHLVAHIVEDFSAYHGDFKNAPVLQLSETETTVSYQSPNYASTHDFYILNTGKSELIIRKIITSDEETTVTLPKYVIKPGKKVKATLNYKSNKITNTTKLIQFISNAPSQHTVSYQLHINPNT